MTYIEFSDKNAVENLCACLAAPPTRVIFIGDKLKSLQKQAKIYSALLEERGINIEIICRAVNKNSMRSILEQLTHIVETYDDCAFDLTGGDELYLTAVGIIFERFKDKHIQMHRFNIHNNSVHDCDPDGRTIANSAMPALTVRENIRLYGGKIVADSEKPNGTYEWDWTNDFIDDVNLMWDICKDDVRLWNTQIGVFAAAAGHFSDGIDKLALSAPIPVLSDILKRAGTKYVYIKSICKRLCDVGLIEYFCDNSRLKISFKNEQVKRCLTKSGQILEMKICLAAATARDKTGNYTYNDVENGVCIDWDGDIHTDAETRDTENEIDALLMHGMVPVFVSCKNGHVDIGELYKLSTVADRFGGKYAKKVLVATALEGNGDSAEYLRQRASDMKIRVVENVQNMSGSELTRVVSSFWFN